MVMREIVNSRSVGIRSQQQRYRRRPPSHAELPPTVERPRRPAREGRRGSDNMMRTDSPIKRTIFRGPVLRGARNTEYLHVSHLITQCVRQKALARKLRVPLPSQELWDSQSITFKTGEGIGEFIVDRMKAMDGRVYGDWRCPCRQSKYTGLQTIAQSMVCNTCGHPTDIYEELHLKDEDYMLVGHCDLAVEWDNALYLTEIKSTNENGANEVQNAPKMDHLLQLLFYIYMARRAGLEVHSRASVLYVRKEWMRGNPYTEHVITYEDHAHLLEPYLAEALEYAEFFDTKLLPTRTVCSEMTDTRATQCYLCHECFSNV